MMRLFPSVVFATPQKCDGSFFYIQCIIPRCSAGHSRVLYLLVGARISLIGAVSWGILLLFELFALFSVHCHQLQTAVLCPLGDAEQCLWGSGGFSCDGEARALLAVRCTVGDTRALLGGNSNCLLCIRDRLWRI